VNKLPSGEELKRRCQELGVDTSAVVYQSGHRINAGDEELQRRLIEAERSAREHKLWIVALVSAIASVLSAVTALVAVAVALGK
jgi:hypothetical protein